MELTTLLLITCCSHDDNKGSEVVVMWSKMFGGKKYYETIQAFEWFLAKYNTQSDTLCICHDYQFVCQFWLRYSSWICHPANPERKFKCVLFASYVYFLK